MKLKSVITFVVATCFMVGWVLVMGLRSVWRRPLPAWVHAARRWQVSLLDLGRINARNVALGLQPAFRTGSLILTRSHTGFGMIQNLGMDSITSHAAMLVMFPEHPQVPFVYEVTTKYGTMLRPLGEYFAGKNPEEPACDVWIRPYCGPRELHEDVVTGLLPDPQYDVAYSYGFHATMMERLLQSVLPVHWPFRREGLLFCSEWLMLLYRRLGLFPRPPWTNAAALWTPDYDLQYWLPADMEPGRRLDRLLPGMWGEPIRLRPLQPHEAAAMWPASHSSEM